MTRRDRSLPEIFSLSFLDLIFCAMAGVLVLYSIADSGSSDPGEDDQPLTYIEVQFKADAKTALILLEVENGDNLYSATNQFGDVSAASGVTSWTMDPGGPDQPLIARLILREEIEGEAALRIRILDHDLAKDVKQYDFRKLRIGTGSTTPEIEGSLTSDTHFGVEIPL